MLAEIEAKTSSTILFTNGGNYNVLWTSPAGAVDTTIAALKVAGSGSLRISQDHFDPEGEYWIYRGFVIFDTSSISGTVSSSTLRFWGYPEVGLQLDDGVAVVSGMPIFPHDPVDMGDYDKTNFDTFCGQVLKANINLPSDPVPYTDITLDTSLIQVGGITKFCLKTIQDKEGNGPTVYEGVQMAAGLDVN